MTSSTRKLLDRRWVRITATAIALTVWSSTVQAQLTYYATRAQFNAVAQQTTLVNFQAGVIADPANGASFEGPLTSTTDTGARSSS
jgi:putative copper export protein